MSLSREEFESLFSRILDPVRTPKAYLPSQEEVDSLLDALLIASKGGTLERDPGPLEAEEYFKGPQEDGYKEEDLVNHPNHYTSGEIECIDAIRSALTPEEFRGFCKGNVLKYTWRERHKGGNQSMEKSIWYINQLLKASKG